LASRGSLSLVERNRSNSTMCRRAIGSQPWCCVEPVACAPGSPTTSKIESIHEVAQPVLSSAVRKNGTHIDYASRKTMSVLAICHEIGCVSRSGVHNDKLPISLQAIGSYLEDRS